MDKLFTELHIEQYVNMSIVLGCLIVGYIIKNSRFLNMIDNRNIPLLVTVLGIVINIVITMKVTYDIILSGAISGMVSTGFHQAFHQTIKKYIERYTEMPIDPEITKGDVTNGDLIDFNTEADTEEDGDGESEDEDETESDKTDIPPSPPEAENKIEDKPVTIDEVFSALHKE